MDSSNYFEEIYQPILATNIPNYDRVLDMNGDMFDKVIGLAYRTQCRLS